MDGQRLKKIRERRRLIPALIVGMLLILGGVCFQRRPTPLLSTAVRIVSTSDWFIEEDDYRWLTDNTIAALCNPPERDWQAFEITCVDGRRLPLKEFNRSFGSRAMHDPLRWQASPDGKWLLWTAGSDADPLWIASEIRGSRRLEWPREPGEPSYQYCTWLPDSQRWIEWTVFDAGTRVRLYYLDRNRKSPVQIAMLPAGTQVLGVTAENRIVTTDLPTYPRSNSGRLDEYDLNRANDPAVLHSVVSAPSGVTGINEVCLSPNGKYIAWSLQSDPPKAGSLWANIYQRAFGLSGATASIWVSKSDGTEMREIGCQPADDFFFTDYPSCIQWNPGGSQISFLDRGAFWCVSVR